MDKVLKSFLIKTVAAFCIYLTWSIGTTSAIEISIYRQLTSGVQTGAPLTVTLDPTDIIEKKFEFIKDPADTRMDNIKVKIEVIGKSSDYPISKIYLFKCKDSKPLDCVDYEPVEAESFLSGDKGTFYWEDVSRGTDANFLTLVKFTHNGKDSWTGFWDTAAKKDVTEFEKNTYEISDIDLYLKPGILPSWVEEFISEHYMIPATWVEKAVLKTIGDNAITEMYQLVANDNEITSGVFGRYNPKKNYIESFTKDYLFALAKGSIASPVTFFQNSEPDCGDGACETGENPGTCCLDCGCDDENQECTATDDYPNGMCHVCGDGVPDAVENSTNCCVDVPCPGNFYCDEITEKCIAPNCRNGDCEPSEDSRTCAYDCWNTPGKTCPESYSDESYYYDAQEQDCVMAVCPNDKCEWEAGEDYTTCCADCETESPCPAGEYCKTDLLTQGVCTSTNCGNGDCETKGGEDYTNCCDDCPCPVDARMNVQMSCDGVCHICENGKIELPYETESNCCQDVGCTTGYCSITGSCLAESEMEMTASIIPEKIDCTQAASIPKVKFTPVQTPYNLHSYDKVTYTYSGGLYTLDSCSKEGDSYICDFPLSFQGCFETPGEVSVDFTVTVKYFDDSDGMGKGELKYNDIETSLDFEITKTRQRICKKDGNCDMTIGENVDVCCWDCKCSGDDVCTSAGCKEESEIHLFTRPEYLPSRSDIDCSPSNGKQSTDEFTFTANIDNVPESSYEPFKILAKSFEYNGQSYTASKIPGFECTAIEMSSETITYHTGEIECKMPVAYFPACNNPDEKADVTLNLNVLGGGLSKHYNTIEGKPLSATFELEYIEGLPKCGDGYKDANLGETQENCCQDMGCPDDKVCTSVGCVGKSEIGVIATIDPTIDCSIEVGQDPREKTVSLGLEMTHEPYSPETNGVILDDDIYIGDRSIRDMLGTCVPTTQQGQYAWTCSIPTTNFNPFCWDQSGLPMTETVSTKLSWRDRNGNIVKHDVEEDVTFTIDPPRLPECNGVNGCEAELGEAPNDCCWDCGCTGEGMICTEDNVCMNGNDVRIEVIDVSPNGLDCRASAITGNNLVLDVKIHNAPHNLQMIKWFMISTRGDKLNEQYFTCKKELSDFGDPTGNYKCEMPVYNFPDCDTSGKNKKLTLEAKMLFMQGRERTSIERNTLFLVDVDKEGNPLCGNTICQKELGENDRNCCEDCGCNSADGDICTEDGNCVEAEDLRLVITPTETSTSCSLTPGKLDMANYDILNYGCNFQNAVTLEARLVDTTVPGEPSVKPVNSGYSSVSYIWEYDKPTKTGTKTERMPYSGTIQSNESAFGWTLTTVLDQGKSFITTMSTDERDIDTYMKDITITLGSSSARGHTKEFTRTSDDVVTVKVTMIKEDYLLNYEDVFDNMRKAQEKAERLMCTIMGILAFCTGCSIMAGGTDPDAAGLFSKDGSGTSAENLLIGAGGLEKKYSGLIDVADIIPFATGRSSNSGGTNPAMFTSLVGELGNSKRLGAGLGGLAVGAIFATTGTMALHCGSTDKIINNYWIAVMSAIVVCGAMLATGGTAVIKIVKGCDILAVGVKLIFIITNLQRTSQNYHICMVSAEAALAKAKSSSAQGQDPYYLAEVTNRYYQQVAACSDQMATKTNDITRQFSDFSYEIADTGGLSSAGIAITPDGDEINPGDEINIMYNYPDSGNNGMITVAFDYGYYMKSGESAPTEGYTSKSQRFYMRGSSGVVTCTVSRYGLSCNGIEASGSRSNNLQLKPAAECKECGNYNDDFYAEGTITITATGALRSHTYDFNSKKKV